MTRSSFTPTARNIMTIRVVSYENGCIKGILTSSEYEEEMEFLGAIPLILMMEEIMNGTNVPQRGEEHRSFAPGKSRFAAAARKEKLSHTGSLLGTFQIHVLFRQNTTWQGRLVWIDQNMEASFRSVLELLELLDSALSQ